MAPRRPRLLLVDPAPQVAEAWHRALASCPDVLDGVEVHLGSITDVDADTLVGAGNSFGFMDGGVDLVLARHLGWHVQAEVQAAIDRDHDGELLVGRAVVVPTGHPRHRWLLAAPTMRVPMRLPRDTVNPYLAMRAVLLALRDDHPDASVVAVPGLGTGTGGVDPDVAARQMVAAIRHVRDGHGDPYLTWDDAVHEHRILGGLA